MSDSATTTPHIALIPSSGMGHLTPFLRLVATLTTNKKCQLTLITMHPTVSLAESRLISHLLSSFPQISYKQFHLLPFDTSTANSQDPFFLQFESIRRSAHLLSPLLSSSSPPFAAVITDITLASAFLPITTILSIPNYLLFTSSARMLSFLAHFPFIDDISSMQEIQIPGSSSWPIPKSWIPQPLNDPTNLFSTQFIENGKKIIESSGILVNTFNSLEPESLVSLNEGKVVNGLPPVITIGPLVPCDFERVGSPLKWLDDQADGSVVYVSFGSRTAMPREQIKEVGVGLVRSGCRFMWVVKDKKVDREDEEGVEEVLGSELMEQLKEKGLVVKSWVDQMAILSHSAVGGFLSHCGWNSVTEAAWNGVRMLAWPQSGDQRINAEVVEKSGLGRWVKSWGWLGEAVVGAEEIAKRVKEIMADEGLRAHAANVRDEARKAVGAGGSSEQGLLRFVENVGKVGTMLNFSYQAS